MKASVLGLLIAAGAFGASTVYLTLQLQQERAQADRVAELARQLNARIVELEQARAELETQRLLGSYAPEESAQRESMSVKAARGATSEQELRSGAEISGAARMDPGPRPGPGATPERSAAMQKMVRTQIRANYKRIHADIGEKLGLSAEEANKLLDLMVDQQMTLSAATRQSRGSGLTAEQRAAERAALQAAQQARNLAEVSALIGAERMEAYKAYQETLPARQEVDMLSRQLEANDLGLSSAQRDRLVSALADERNRVPAPKLAESASREAYNEALATWQEDYDQRAASRASSILTSEQQATFTEYQQWNAEMRQRFESRRAARERRAAGAQPR